MYESFTGQSTHTICKQLCEIFNIYEDPNLLVQSKRKHFKVIFDNDTSFQMIDGALELIQDYFDNNITLVLASSASMTILKEFLKNLI